MSDQKRGGPAPPHAIDARSLGSYTGHYRCHQVWAPRTNSERISQNDTWFPHSLKMPSADEKQSIVAAAKNLTQALLQTVFTPIIPN